MNITISRNGETLHSIDSTENLLIEINVGENNFIINSQGFLIQGPDISTTFIPFKPSEFSIDQKSY